MAAPPAQNRGRSLSWQEKLQDHCRSNQYHPPIFNIVSDRRGGRTAWSSTVTIPAPNSPTNQQTVQARYWYDGTYINNAKEDAAEVALRILTGGGAAASPTGSSGSSFGSNTSSGGWGGGASSAGATPGIGVGAAWPRSPPATGRW